MTALSIALGVIIAGLLFFVRQTRQRSALLERQLGELRSQLFDSSSRIADFRSQIEELSGKVATLSNLLETSRPTPAPPIDSEVLRKMTEGEMIELAESIATLRPLVPYPGWRFGADLSNPDLAFQMRQLIWQTFHTRKSEAPITVGWHLGTRLRLHLGNDLSRQIYVGGCIDPNEFAFLDRYLQPGMTFIDAGANEGIYTIFAEERVGGNGTVWAFEPSRREFQRLQSNVDLNASLNGSPRATVRLFPFALADRPGKAELTIAGSEHAGHNTLGAFAYEGVAIEEKQIVDLRRLDDVVAEEPPSRIDVIKLDVEGTEMRVLEGAESVLQRYRPVLLLEVSQASLDHQDTSREKLLGFLRARDYSLYLFDSSGLPAYAPPDTYGDNMLAVPVGTALPSSVFQLWTR